MSSPRSVILGVINVMIVFAPILIYTYTINFSIFAGVVPISTS